MPAHTLSSSTNHRPVLTYPRAASLPSPARVQVADERATPSLIGRGCQRIAQLVYQAGGGDAPPPPLNQENEVWTGDRASAYWTKEEKHANALRDGAQITEAASPSARALMVHARLLWLRFHCLAPALVKRLLMRSLSSLVIQSVVAGVG